MTGQLEPGAGELIVRPGGGARSASVGRAPAATAEPAGGPPPAVPPGPPAGRPRRRKTLVVSVLVIVLAGARAGAYAVLAASWEDSGGAPAAKAVTTAPVTRTTLVDTEQDDGSLGYDDQQMLRCGVRGVLTGLPAEGATVTRGHTLYRVRSPTTGRWPGRCAARSSCLTAASATTRGGRHERHPRQAAVAGRPSAAAAKPPAARRHPAGRLDRVAHPPAARRAIGAGHRDRHRGHRRGAGDLPVQQQRPARAAGHAGDEPAVGPAGPDPRRRQRDAPRRIRGAGEPDRAGPGGLVGGQPVGDRAAQRPGGPGRYRRDHGQGGPAHPAACPARPRRPGAIPHRPPPTLTGRPAR